MAQRNPVIDVCKGIGILLVIVGHLGTVWGSPIYMFHMSLFFILSGICFSDKYLVRKFEFVRKRFLSLMLPFLIFKGIAYVIVHFSPWQEAADFIDHYHLLGTLWFLKCLFVASIIGLGIIWALQKVRYSKRWIPALLALTMASILSMTVGNDNKAVFLWFTFHFLVGYAVKPYLSALCDTNASMLKILTFGGITSLLLLPSCTPNVIADCTYVEYLPYCVTAFGGIWLTVRISAEIICHSRLTEALSEIGAHTMPIVIFQWSAFAVIDITVKRFGITMPEQWLLTAKFFAGDRKSVV